MRIWKIQLSIVDWQEIEVPEYAYPLTVQMQKGQPQLWFLCDENARKETRMIAIYGTGNPVPDEVDPCEYIATFQDHGGSLVWHVFEVTKDR